MQTTLASLNTAAARPKPLTPRQRLTRDLDLWRASLAEVVGLERAYLFVHLLNDARLLRQASWEALAHARRISSRTGQVRGTWWAGLWSGGIGSSGPGGAGPRFDLRRELAEQSFWRRLDGLPPLPLLEDQAPPQTQGWGPGATLGLARAAALLRQGPDGHASLALAELACGKGALAQRRFGALAESDWRNSADNPRRVGQCLALGRGVIAAQRGDLASARREWKTLARPTEATWDGLAARYALALWEGDLDEGDELRRVAQRRAEAGDVCAAPGAGLPLGDWAQRMDRGARLGLSYALEHDSSPLVAVASAMGEACLNA